MMADVSRVAHDTAVAQATFSFKKLHDLTTLTHSRDPDQVASIQSAAFPPESPHRFRMLPRCTLASVDRVPANDVSLLAHLIHIQARTRVARHILGVRLLVKFASLFSILSVAFSLFNPFLPGRFPRQGHHDVRSGHSICLREGLRDMGAG